MNLLVKCLVGSRLYGLNHAESDTDYSSIYLPTLDQVLLGTAPDLMDASTSDATRKNKGDDTDHLVYSLKYFIFLACAGKQQVIDMLHAEPSETLITSPVWQELQANRKHFYSKSMSSSVDFITKQIALYGHRARAMECLAELMATLGKVRDEHHASKIRDFANKLPVNEYTYFVACDSDGFHKEVRWKDYKDQERNVFYRVDGSLNEISLSYNQLHFQTLVKQNKRIRDENKCKTENKGKDINWSEVSHAMRVGYQVLSILIRDDFHYPLPQTAFLKEIKSGVLDFRTHVQPEAELLISEIKRYMFTSTLPETVSTEYWDKWLLDIYYREFGLSKES